MSGTGLLVGLLMLAYLGSMLVKGRAIRGFGLPSGSEYLVLGFLLGPQVLGLLDRGLVRQFEPVVVVGLGWLAFVVGIAFLRVGTRRLGARRIAMGVTLSALVVAAMFAAVFVAARFSLSLDQSEGVVLALGVALICADTTRHSVRWVAEAHGAGGPVTEFAADLARSSALVPLLGASLLFALVPSAGGGDLPLWTRALFPPALGLGLGGLLALLVGREFRKQESWGLLLGTALLVAGACLQLGLSAISALFTLGLTLAFSRHHDELKAMIAPSEQPVMLPVFVLAGASINVRLPLAMLGLLACALLLKVLVRIVFGSLTAVLTGPARLVAIDLGFSQLSCGVVSVLVATSIALRGGSALGEALLTFAAVAMVFGELIGPVRLQRALEQASEIGVREQQPLSTVDLSVPEGGPR